MKKLVALLAVAMFANFVQAAVWVEENQWNADWDRKYREWLKVTPSTKMFSLEKKANGEANPYYGLRVDCADLVYSLRIIFSYENKLPFVMTNPIGRSGSPPITNQLTRFDKVAEGAPRLRSFLRWIYDMVSTHALPEDTYSVGFKDVKPGIIILTTKTNHHSWTITDISKAGNPTLFFNSTNGREAGFDVQMRQSWPNPFWVFEPEVSKKDPDVKIPVYVPGSYAGFRFWRPAEFINSPEKSVPGYSEDQFGVGLAKWSNVAKSTLAKVKENTDQIVGRLLKDACADFKQRIDAVQEAEDYKTNMAADFAAGKTEENSSYIKDYISDPERPSDRRCLTFKTFDRLSTPSRDKRTIDSLSLARAYFSYGLKKFGLNSFPAANLNLYRSIFPLIEGPAADEAKKDDGALKSNYCSYAIPEVGTLSLAQFKRRVFAGRFSSNPNDSYTVRFGSSKTSKDLGDLCPAFDLTKRSYDLNQIEQEMMQEVLASPPGL